MGRKTTVAYSAALRYLKEEVGIAPLVVITDYEVGLQRAIREIFPIARLTGCLFHFNQVCYLSTVRQDFQFTMSLIIQPT